MEPHVQDAVPSPRTNQFPQMLNSKPRITVRVRYFVQLWSFKTLVSLGIMLMRLFKGTPKDLRPTRLKPYPCRPHLRNRIFIPTFHEAGQLLPLYLDLHGGGHTLLDARFDDQICARLAHALNIVVVSIEYSLAPANKFPRPTNVIVAIAQAIIGDDSLPIDKSRVVLGGFSAGGNLAMSAVQIPDVRDKIKGVVSWYPVLDFSLSPQEKQSSRPYRSKKDTDELKDWGPIWDWA